MSTSEIAPAASPPRTAVEADRGNVRERRLLLILPLAFVALQLVSGGVDLLLASLLDRLQPGASVTTFGWITGIAAAVALAAYPLAGAASDRTAPRFGRRSVWVAIGSFGSAVGLLALGQSGVVGVAGVSYVVAVAFLPVMLVPLYASIPDRVAPGNRGTVGGLVGAGTILGGVFGNVLAARFAGSVEAGTIVFAAVLIAGAIAFVALGGEERGDAAGTREAPKADPSVPRTASADLTWFSAGRFALFFGYAATTGLAYYVMRDYLRQPDPANGVAVFAVVSGGTTLFAALVAGPLSDRLGRRKPFVFAAGVLVGLGALLPALSRTVPAFLAGGAVIGIGFGAYLAVGTALGTLVLPRSETSGRDIGLIGLSNAAAQAVAPIVGASAAATFGYPIFFGLAGGACLAGALAILPIKSSR